MRVCEIKESGLNLEHFSTTKFFSDRGLNSKRVIFCITPIHKIFNRQDGADRIVLLYIKGTKIQDGDKSKPGFLLIMQSSRFILNDLWKAVVGMLKVIDTVFTFSIKIPKVFCCRFVTFVAFVVKFFRLESCHSCQSAL